jgi:signal transduction histidine kinase
MSLDADTADQPADRAPARLGRTGILPRLFALVLVAMLPAMAIQAYNEIAGREMREAEVRDDALRLAQFAAGEMYRIVENARGVLTAVANLPAIRNSDVAGCKVYVTSLQRDFPQYVGIGAIDLTGHPFCANIPIPENTNASDRDFFRTARDTGAFTIGDYIVGRLIARPVLPFGLPFRDASGRIAGVVYASLDLEWLAHHFAENAGSQKNATLLIADRNGTVLIREPNNAGYAGKKLGPEYGSQVFAKEPGTAEITGVDGVKRIIGFVPTGALSKALYIGVGLTETDAFAGINDATRFGFLLIGVGLATGLIVAWLGGRYFISRPIDRLARAAAQWGRGNFAARTGLESGGRSELTELGVTFDTMAEQLLREQQENASLLATLENRVEDRTRVLETTNRELRGEMQRREQAEEALRHLQKVEALGQLTGGVAHDFNNILQVILASLDAVQRRLSRGGSITPTDGGSQIEAAIRSAERAAILTRQLLAFARRQPLAPQTVDLNRLVQGMSELLRRTLGETIQIETVLSGGLWPVSVDVSQLESAIINIAVNARDAMSTGGRLTIETANAFLDEDYAGAHGEVQPGQYVMLAMTDSGAGMSREVLEQAFDPFFTTKEIGQGTGLGLSQVYGFIKQSGGHVKIYSRPGEGTTVKMYLKRLASLADVLAAPQRDDAPPSGVNEIILVVEDEEMVRETTIAMLSDLGYSIREAANGEAALRILSESDDIHLLFTDIGLPGGLNGRQLADKAHELRPGLRVLYTTGYARNAVVHHGVLDAGVELLVKPFSYAALATKIRSLLDRG